MKKAIAVFLVTCLTVGLAGCVSVGVQYRCMGDAEQISQIAVFDLRNEITTRIDDAMTPVGYVDQDSYAAFAEELEAFPFVDQYILILAPMDPSFSYGGYVVRITYEDGSYELIGSAGYQSRYADGVFAGGSHYSCDADRWEQFVRSYMESVQ
jgi:hypothetical protein